MAKSIKKDENNLDLINDRAKLERLIFEAMNKEDITDIRIKDKILEILTSDKESK